MAGEVWVVPELAGGEATEPTLEALGEAAELARPERPGILAVGPSGTGPALAALGAHGAGRAVLLEVPPEPAAEAIGLAAGAWLREHTPAGDLAVLLPHTRHGRTVAARLAVVLEAGLLPDAVATRRAPDGGVVGTRPAYGDRLHATVRIPAGIPAVITLRPGALGVGPAESAPRLAVERLPVPPAPGVRVARLRRRLAADPRTVDLREAGRIVAGGGGVGGADGFRLLQELADLLGAAVGGSRVAVDRGWLPWARQIGQSGRTVAPDLYLAFGISGASQHLAGIQAARTVVAVDTDPGTPLMSLAHLGVVGDWQAVAAALVARLRASPPS